VPPVTRRPPIRRRRGIPVDADRCAWDRVLRPGELLPDRCRKPRSRGYRYCAGHLKQVWTENYAAAQAGKKLPHSRVAPDREPVAG